MGVNIYRCLCEFVTKKMEKYEEEYKRQAD